MEGSTFGRLTAVAATRLGLVTTQDARRSGVRVQQLSQLASRGFLLRLHQTVYAVAGTPASWERDVLAACLAAGRNAVASGPTAARLLDIATLDEVIEVTVPRRVRVRGITARHAPLPPVDVTSVGPIPTTSVARTIVDLARTVRRPVFDQIADDAVRRGRVSIPRLRDRAAALSGRGRKGTPVIRGYLEDRGVWTDVLDSNDEQLLLAIIRWAGLPEPVAGHRIRTSAGTFKVDFAYPGPRIFIESDGDQHRSPSQWQKDQDRQNHIVNEGWRPLRFPGVKIRTQPKEVARSVAVALGFTGWTPPRSHPFAGLANRRPSRTGVTKSPNKRIHDTTGNGPTPTPPANVTNSIHKRIRDISSPDHG